MSGDNYISFTIRGEPASKGNARRLGIVKGKPVMFRSKKHVQFKSHFDAQVPDMVPYEGDVEVEMTIYYASRRPDLDEAIVLDLMQGHAYKNDRQVKKKVITWGLDRDNPRCEIIVRPYLSL